MARIPVGLHVSYDIVTQECAQLLGQLWIRFELFEKLLIGLSSVTSPAVTRNRLLAYGFVAAILMCLGVCTTTDIVGLVIRWRSAPRRRLSSWSGSIACTVDGGISRVRCMASATTAWYELRGAFGSKECFEYECGGVSDGVRIQLRQALKILINRIECIVLDVGGKSDKATIFDLLCQGNKDIRKSFKCLLISGADETGTKQSSFLGECIKSLYLAIEIISNS